MKNFKSFKSVTLRFDRGFNLVLGPNGSGKSNVMDALRFVFGEKSLRSMRARNVSQLIFNGAGLAEIEVKLRGGEGELHILKRFIRKDGKTKYKLDGKVVKRYDVVEFLTINRLYMSNFIIQGEIERIVQMSTRERRGLVDDVSNVGEYELKKQEAMRELGVVQSNLGEASVSLGERKGYLEELKRDKEAAEKFLRLKRERDELEASLVYIDVSVLEKELEGLVSNLVEAKRSVESLDGEISVLKGRVEEKTAELADLNAKILAGSEGEKASLERESAQLEAKVGELKNRIVEFNGKIETGLKEERELKGLVLRSSDELDGLKRQLKEKTAEFERQEKLVSDLTVKVEEKEKSSTSFGKDYFKNKAFIQKTEEEIAGLNVELQKLQGLNAELEGFRKAKLSELDLFKKGGADSEGGLEDIADRKVSLGKRLDGLNSELKSFGEKIAKSEEKKAFLEGEILKAREKVGVLASQQSGVSAVSEGLKGFKGVYGVVGELCGYEGLSVPVEVSLGGRFNFFVVDSVDVAVKAVSFLKTNKLGRASFIPLDKVKSDVRSAGAEKVCDALGNDCEGFLVDLVRFDKKFDKVFRFVFGDTLLVKSVDACKSFIGRARMVTREGELFETSGLVSGGVWKSSGLALRREGLELEARLKRLEGERKDLLAELSDLTLSVDKLRGEKGRVEVDLQVVVFEEKSALERKGKFELAEKEKKEKLRILNDELKIFEKRLEENSVDRKRVISKISELNVELVDARSRVDVDREKDLNLELKSLEKSLGELKDSRNKLSVEVQVLKGRVGLSEKELNSLNDREGKFKDEETGFGKSVKTFEAELKGFEARLVVVKKSLGELSSTTSVLEKKRGEVGAEISVLSNKKGSLEFKRGELLSKIGVFETKKAVCEANLVNKKELFSAFEGLNLTFSVTVEDKPRLLARLKEVQSDLPDETKVNLKAIEEFGLKVGEVEELSGRVKVLEGERASILGLIEETEERKISTFMNVFNFINSNFQKLFSQIFEGEGKLVLDDEKNPFNGGLSIKVSLKSKGVSFLDLMSGGEKSLIALIFLFSIQSYNPSSVYVLDEADAALDHENAQRLSVLVKKLSADSQFFIISHNQSVFREADCLIGVSMVGGESRLVEVSVSES